MGEYRYKLTLELVDEGERSFTVSREFDTRIDMQEGIRFDVPKMLATMSLPPEPWMLLVAYSDEIGNSEDPNCPVSFLAYLCMVMEVTESEYGLEEAVRLVVDIEKLMGSATEGQKEYVRSLLRASTWAAASDESD